MRLGRGLHRSHQYDAALAEYQKGRDLRQQLVDLSPTDQEYQRALANSIMNIGTVEKDREHLDAAAEQFRSAQQLRKSQLAAGDSFKLDRDLAMGFYNQGNLEIKRQQPAEAATFFGQAIEHFEKLRAQDPRDLTLQYYLALSYREAAAANSEMNSRDESQPTCMPWRTTGSFRLRIGIPMWPNTKRHWREST